MAPDVVVLLDISVPAFCGNQHTSATSASLETRGLLRIPAPVFGLAYFIVWSLLSKSEQLSKGYVKPCFGSNAAASYRAIFAHSSSQQDVPSPLPTFTLDRALFSKRLSDA